MKTIIEILDKMRQIKPELLSRYGVKRLAIFGSYSRGEQRENSDVDIVVDVDPSIGLRFVDLGEEIESLLGIQTDIVSRRAIKLRNWEVIEKELIHV